MEIKIKDIQDACQEIQDMLVEKNKSYGSSISDPVNVFCNEDIGLLNLIDVRLDDKLSRIKRGNSEGDEDTELDIIGYLILKRIIQKKWINK